MIIYSLKNKIDGFLNFKLIFDLSSKKKKIYQYFESKICDLECDVISQDDLLLAHSKNYVDKLYSKVELIEVINSVFELKKYSKNTLNFDTAKMIRDQMFQEVNAVYSCFKKSIVLQSDIFYIGGGMHHAESSFGYGFCLVADVAIGIRKLQKEKLLKNVWIIDLDVHMGNGNSEIFQDDLNVRTLSIHMKEGWPFTERNSICPSDIDIALKEDESYLYLPRLKESINQLHMDSIVTKQEPDLVVIIQGSDPYEKDQLESSSLLNLTLKEMKERDQLVYSFFKKRKVPQVYLMAGGYGDFAHEPYVHFLNFVSISCGKTRLVGR